MYSQYPVINHNGEGYKKDILLLLFSCFSCVPLFATPWTGACQAPLSMEFSRHEYWSGLPCSPPGDFPEPRDQTHTSYVSCIGRQVPYH